MLTFVVPNEDLRLVKVTLPGLPPDVTLSASLDDVTWQAMQRVSPDVFAVYIAGPGHSGDGAPATTLKPARGRHMLRVRSIDTPETETTRVGYVDVGVTL